MLSRSQTGGVLLALLLVGAIAAPAWAARVIDVRIGKHGSYSRVVFELDTPVGYRIERSEPAPGIAELVISLDASSEVRSLSTKNDLIEGVEIRPAGDRSIAHVRLRSEGLRLKEMILANPPRIVLDVMGEEKIAAAKPAPAPAVVNDDRPAPTATPVKLATKTTPAAPDPASITKSREPKPHVPAAKLVAPTTPTERVAAAPKDPGPEPSDGMLPSFDALGDEPLQLAMADPMPATRPAARNPAAAKPLTRVAKPMPAAAPPPAEGSMFSTTNIAIAGGAVALLGLVGFVVMRNRRGKAASEFDPPLVDEGLFDDIGPSSGSTSAGASDVFSIGAAAPEPSTPRADGQSSLFDGNASLEADTVVDEPAPSAPPPMPSAPSDGGDNARITQELERRVAGIESRLDDANEHRDRLEQQVAAQTEELRVQRAAIARTQRAVRNLNRPEEEDAPTEPALRDPGRPGAPRV